MTPRTAALAALFALLSLQMSACTNGNIDGPGQGEDTTDSVSGDVHGDTGSPSKPDPEGPAADGSLRIYVAGESIEQFNRFDAPPFDASGTLVDPDDNGDSEYGWMVPFAERLALRAPGVSVKWVGAEPWIDHDWNETDGDFPPTPGLTSALGGTSIAEWIDEAGEELESQEHCYDVAFAARGGNDNDQDVSETAYKQQLTELIGLLDAGSSCQEHPVIVVTGHMPDAGGWNYEYDNASIQQWMARQQERYVQWNQDVVASFSSDPAVRVQFVDLFTPFVTDQATTAFPNPSWMDGAGIDIDKLHFDGQHPLRLASIYAGEVAADAVEMPGLLAPPKGL